MISFDEDILPPGAYTGFFKGGCGREAPENFFSHPGAELLRTHPFRTHPPFRISLFLDQLQKIFDTQYTNPPFCIPPFLDQLQFCT